MLPAERIQVIETRLRDAFHPTTLRIEDDSAQHVGHAGSRGGAGHYTVVIEAEAFQGLSRVKVHRAIYAVLEDLIPDEVHALRIRISD